MAYSPLGNPSAPPTREWESDSVPLIQGMTHLGTNKRLFYIKIYI